MNHLERNDTPRHTPERRPENLMRRCHSLHRLASAPDIQCAFQRHRQTGIEGACLVLYQPDMSLLGRTSKPANP